MRGRQTGRNIQLHDADEMLEQGAAFFLFDGQTFLAAASSVKSAWRMVACKRSRARRTFA